MGIPRDGSTGEIAAESVQREPNRRVKSLDDLLLGAEARALADRVRAAEARFGGIDIAAGNPGTVDSSPRL